MKKFFFVFMLFSSIESFATPAKLRYSVDFIFKKVLEKKRLSSQSNIPFPSVHFESTTSLKYFQDAIESQWGMRPDSFTNAYAFHSNEVFILDESEYYDRNQRCMDDSLAHELVHYLQVKYQGWDTSDDSLEWEAIDIQSQFREEFCR